MRVALIASHFPVPSETFVIRQAARLLDRGHDVRIFADWPGEPRVQNALLDSHGLIERTSYVEMPRLAGYWEQPVWPLWGRTWPPGAERPVPNARRLVEAAPAFARAVTRSPRLTAQVLSQRHYGSKARSLSPLYRLASLARERGPFDAVVANFGWSAHDFRFAARLWNAPLVAIFRGGGDLDFGPGVDLRAYYRDLFQTAAAVTGQTRYTMARIERFGCPPEKLHRLPSPVDLTEFEYRDRTLRPGDTVRILSVGRLVEMKGQRYAIDALARLRGRHPRVRLDVVGAGELRDELEAQVRDLGLGESVTFHGALPHEQTRRLMGEAHLFVMPSVTPANGDHEGQGLSLQEAQACGLPVVATDHGPFREGVVPGGSALLVPERDSEALASALAGLIGDPARWPEMGRAGREHVERNFDVREVDRRLDAILREVTGRSPAEPAAEPEPALVESRG